MSGPSKSNIDKSRPNFFRTIPKDLWESTYKAQAQQYDSKAAVKANEHDELRQLTTKDVISISNRTL